MANKKVSILRLRPVLEVAPFSRAEVVAMQALAHGIADTQQQKLILNWLIYQACDFDGVSYRDTDRETCFAEGKKFVAQQINALLTFNARKLEEPNNDR